MDRFGEWRPIAPAAKADADDDLSTQKPAKPVDTVDGSEANALNVRLIGLLGAGVLGIVGVVIWLTNPGSGAETRLDVAAAAGYFSVATPVLGDPGGARSATPAPQLVIDVEGAVIRPGIHYLAPGSRVGDAINAAGGYSTQVDLAAASATLNLAAPLIDGAKVHVPVRGEAKSSVAPGGGPSGGGDGGSINVNMATADELDTLPGIGPVTAAKIIAAREQAPFATLDELVSREVLGPATLEKIRALATVTP